jgi:hypothetical protein
MGVRRRSTVSSSQSVGGASTSSGKFFLDKHIIIVIFGINKNQFEILALIRDQNVKS